MASRDKAETNRNDDAQRVVSHLLLERIRQDKYPSVTQMTLLEEILPRSLYREYLNVLLEKAISTPTPSITMLRRIERIAQQI